MSAARPPTKTFLSKHRPGGQAGQATPIPADRREHGPDQRLPLLQLAGKAKASVSGTEAVAMGRSATRPTWKQVLGIPEPSSLLTMVRADLWVFLS